MTTKYRVEYLLLRSAYFLVNLLPLKLINVLTGVIGWCTWVFFPFRISVAYDNLSTVFPDISHRNKLHILKDAYLYFIHAAGAIFVIHRPAITELIAHAEVSGLDVLDRALAEEKGVILTTYHGCWFEPYFAWFSRGERPASLIYQQQSNPLCDSFFVKLRQRYGDKLQHIHSLEKLKVYKQALLEKRILIISLDQNYTDNGTPVTFFGKTFTCARGAALLHLQTKAPVLTSVYYMENNTLHIDFEAVDLPEFSEVNDQAIQQICNLSISGYEKTIRRFPTQWFSLFHRLWKKDGYPPKVPRSFKDIF